MPGPIRICPLAELALGEAIRVDTDELDGVCPPIAIFRTEDDEVFAIDDTCTHQDASLADGWLEGCEVECPLHASKFNLKTGNADAPPAKRPVRTHQVTVDEETVFITLSDEAPNLPPGVVPGGVA